MKKLLLYLFIFSVLIYAQDEKKIDSKVVEATVFKNRALVTREGETELTPGIHNLVFSNLPVDLLDESVRVSASGNGVVKILDVKVEQKFTTETQQVDIKSLEEKIDSLGRLKQVSLDKISIYESKKSFVEALKAQSAEYISEKSFLSVNSKSMSEVLKYVEDNLEEIYNGLRTEKQKIVKYDQQINTLRAEISQAHGMRSKNYKEVLVTIEAEKRGKIKLNPSYIVQSASWYPVYDARITSDTKNAEISYFGMVNQQTGEDWKDISLSLSTAEPMSVKSLPELDRWFLDIRPQVKPVSDAKWNRQSAYNISYEQNAGVPSGKGSVTGYITDAQTGEPLYGANAVVDGTNMGSAADDNGKFFIPNIPAGQYNVRFLFVGYESVTINMQVREKNIANVIVSLHPTSIEAQEVVVTAESGIIDNLPSMYAGVAPEMRKVQYTSVQANELSTSFEIRSKSNIPSDNSQHKVTIDIDNTPVDFSYTSIPKINPAVYVKGKLVNKNDFPLLEGEMSIFVDNDFVNRTGINTIVPSDTLSLALGIDERIPIKKVLANKFQESKGLLGGSRQITYDYEIQVTNNRKTEESVLIYDQLPIAMNEEIKVEILEPEKTEKDLGNDKKLEWSIKLAPGEKKIIPLKYTVTYPNNITVYGLE